MEDDTSLVTNAEPLDEALTLEMLDGYLFIGDRARVYLRRITIFKSSPLSLILEDSRSKEFPP